MSDIVERLRQSCLGCEKPQRSDGGVRTVPLGLVREAADEIERLTQLLAYAASKNEEEIAADRAMTRASALEEAATMADQWSTPAAMKLAAGEMTAQELRTAQSVARGIAAAIRNLRKRVE